MHTFAHMHIFAHSHTFTHIRIHAHMHTYMHTPQVKIADFGIAKVVAPGCDIDALDVPGSYKRILLQTIAGTPAVNACVYDLQYVAPEVIRMKRALAYIHTYTQTYIHTYTKNL